MAVIALTSAAGSPGVTTTAVGLTLSWPRPVLLVEADPTGASSVLAGYFRGTRAYDVGLIELALSPATPGEALPDVVRPLNGHDAWFLAGTRSPAQAAGLSRIWAPLSVALAGLEDLGQDVIIDAGRLGLVGSPEPLIESADLTLLLTRSTLPALAAARAWTSVPRGSKTWRQSGVLLVGEGQPYRPAEIAKSLDLPIVATLPDAPAEAAVFHRGDTPPRGFDTGPYARSLRAAIAAVQACLESSRAVLIGQP